MEINSEEYKPNSHKYKEEQKLKEEKKVEKIVNSPVIVKKKSGFKKLKDSIISDDIGSIKSFIFGDILVPTIKKTLYDIFTESINIIIYGESRNNRRSPISNISYRTPYYDNYTRYSSKPESRRYINNSYECDEIILTSRAEAEDVLDTLSDLLQQYGLISIADLYDLVGKPGDPTDNAYGWTSIKNARIVRVREGYLIEMPKAMPID